MKDYRCNECNKTLYDTDWDTDWDKGFKSWWCRHCQEWVSEKDGKNTMNWKIETGNKEVEVTRGTLIFTALIAFLCLFFLVGLSYGFSWCSWHYEIWSQGMKGQAQLAHAQYNRQIATCEANAKKESAKSLADAEVIRAEGVAKANKIIGDSLKENESYLRYLWIQGLQTENTQVIYVPTEANLPILEARRLNE